MAVTYAPAYELHNGPTTVVASRTIGTLLDDWHRQPYLPVATSALGRWLMDQVGYTPPLGPRTVWPRSGGGRGYPRGGL